MNRTVKKFKLIPCVKVESLGDSVVNVFLPYGKEVPYTKSEFEQAFHEYESEKDKISYKISMLDADIEVVRAEIEHTNDLGDRNILQQQLDAMVKYKNILMVRYNNL